MYSYIIRRLAFGALTVFGVSIVVFVVMRVLPGDPLVAIFGPEGFTKLSDAERASYMAQLGLSDPLIVQYLHWMRRHRPRQFRPLVLPLRERRRDDRAARPADRGDRAALGRAVVDRRHSGGDRQRAAAEQPRRQHRAVPQHPVPGGAGLLGRHADRAGLLFWFGYRAPLAGASLFADPWANLQIVIGPAVVLAWDRPPISRAWRAPACWR